jgi:hypothetical protein
MGVEWWPVHRLIAYSAGPGGVPAAVPETRLMPYQDFAGAKEVAVRAASRRMRDPLPGRGLYELAQHDYKAYAAQRAKLGPAACRILGSALAAGVPRGEGPPFYLACRVSRAYGKQVSNEFGLAVCVGFDEYVL